MNKRMNTEYDEGGTASSVIQKTADAPHHHNGCAAYTAHEERGSSAPFQRTIVSFGLYRRAREYSRAQKLRVNSKTRRRRGERRKAKGKEIGGPLGQSRRRVFRGPNACSWPSCINRSIGKCSLAGPSIAPLDAAFFETLPLAVAFSRTPAEPPHLGSSASRGRDSPLAIREPLTPHLRRRQLRRAFLSRAAPSRQRVDPCDSLPLSSHALSRKPAPLPEMER
jgi:hypothetical protein